MVEVMIERIEDSNLGRVLFSVFFSVHDPISFVAV